MTSERAVTLAEKTTEKLLAEQAVDTEVLALSNEALVLRLIGDDAAHAVRRLGSLWRLLDERGSLRIDGWREREKLDVLAELVRRLGEQAPEAALRGVSGPEEAAALFAHLALLPAEELWVAYLNAKNIPLAVVKMGVGAVNEVSAYPSRIFREALVRSAAGILIAHNHPSGDPTPSAADRFFSEKLFDGGRLVGVAVVDQLILGREGRVYSFVAHDEVRLSR